MSKHLCISIFLLTIGLRAVSQAVVVNPDGTHTVVVGHGPTAIGINSNGTHSTVINHGGTLIVINPNGTHSVGVSNGGATALFSQEGTISMFDHGPGSYRHNFRSTYGDLENYNTVAKLIKKQNKKSRKAIRNTYPNIK